MVALAFFFGASSVVVMSEGFSFQSIRPAHGLRRQQLLPQSPSFAITRRRITTTTTTTTLTTSLTMTRGHSRMMTTTPTSLRGGALFATTASNGTEDAIKCPFTKTMALFGSLWGSLGVVYILAKAIKRVLPIALQPFGGESAALVLTPFQWSMYAVSCLFFAYAEGYKGFQRKFSPLVVKRSFSLVIGTRQGNNLLNYALAPLYSMGLMNATKKRMITSWAVSLGVTSLVVLVKKLSPVWRCVLDAGVVVGLSYGSLSILAIYLKSIMTGQAPAVDACLPPEKKD